MEGRGEVEVEEERRPLGGARGAGAAEDAAQRWPTVDGPLGLSTEEESLEYARSFFLWGFCFLPWLWGLNCLYFWPVLKAQPSPSSPSFARIRPYVLRSAIGFTVFTGLLLTWALTFAIGGERLFGPTWKDLLMYNVADKLGLSGWY